MIPSFARAEAPVKLWVHGNYVSSDVYPYIEQSRTLVPIRVISENLGYDVNWDGVKREVTIQKGNKVMVLAINSNRVSVTENGQNRMVTIDVAARIKNGRTFVPLRAIGEMFGETIDWDGVARTAIVGEGYDFTPSAEKLFNDYVASTKKALEEYLDEVAWVSFDPVNCHFALHPVGGDAEFYRYIEYYPDLDDEYVELWNEDLAFIKDISKVMYDDTGIPFTVSINNPDDHDLMLMAATAGAVEYNFLSDPVIN